MLALPLSSAPAGLQATVTLTALMIAFTAKHVLADFVLQSNWMARGKEAQTEWSAPLLAHVSCHAGFTLLIVLAVEPCLWWLAIVDLVVHAALDRCKALVALRVGWRMNQPQFWWLLGIDQGLHQLTSIGIAATLVLL